MAAVVTIDSREPLWLKTGLSLLVPDLHEAALSCGDFSVASGAAGRAPYVILERKNVADFLSSLIADRLEGQLARCLELGATRTFLMIEGIWHPSQREPGKARYIDIGNRHTGWSHNAVIGKLIALQERNPRLLLLWPSNREATLTTLEYLARTSGHLWHL